MVDIVAVPKALPERIIAFLGHPAFARQEDSAAEATTRDHLEKIIVLLRDSSGCLAQHRVPRTAGTAGKRQDPACLGACLFILSCRNLLICFRTHLQKKLLPLFHYALNPDGLLILGGAETVGNLSRRFEPVDNKLRIFRRLDQPLLLSEVEFPTRRTRSTQQAVESPQTVHVENIGPLTDRLIEQNFTPELSDLTLYVIDVAAGEKIPRKGGPGITKSDLLIINKIDLAPLVGASLDIMAHDAKVQRGERPFVFTNLKTGDGLEPIIDFVRERGMLS